MAYTDEFGNIFGDETDLELYGDTGIFANEIDPTTGFYIPWTAGDVFDWGGANADTFANMVSRFGRQGLDLLKNAFKKSDGSIDWGKIATIGGAILPLLQGSSNRPVGYQGGIPQYTAVREQVPSVYQEEKTPEQIQQEANKAMRMAVGLDPYDPRYDVNKSGTVTSADALAITRGIGQVAPMDYNRRPGSGGRRYFTDVSYVPKTGEGAADALTTAQTAAGQQAQGLAALNAANPLNAAPPAYQPPAPPTTTTQSAPTYNDAYSGENVLKTVREMLNPPQNLARGGIVGLQDGGFVFPADVVSHLGNGSTDAGLAHLTRKGAVPIRGKGDGMSDSNRTTINGRQPAAVANGEAYLPPRQVQNMGGAEKLYAMMDKIRKDRTGTTKQGRQINPNQYV